jgi:hypothetical protein
VFGRSVTVSGDTAVVGADGADAAGGASGSAYVFTRSGGVWTQQAKLTASDAAEGGRFGTSAAVSGDTALVGAYLDDNTGGTDAGSTYVFALGCDTDGDLNGDGAVNGADIPSFTACLLAGPAVTPGCGRADMDDDGDVDDDDVALYVAELLNP